MADTRALNVTANQRSLIRVAVLQRMGRLEQTIAHNRDLMNHAVDEVGREMARNRRDVQLATLLELGEVLKLIDKK